jgi:hypothetical protein
VEWCVGSSYIPSYIGQSSFLWLGLDWDGKTNSCSLSKVRVAHSKALGQVRRAVSP